MLPFWFWFITATIGLGSIGVSAFVVTFMKLAELDARESGSLQQAAGASWPVK